MQKAKRSLDLFPANPVWKISGLPSAFTYKTLFMSLIVISIAFFLSYSDIKNLWIPTSSLAITQASLPGDDIIVDPFYFGIEFINRTTTLPVDNFNISAFHIYYTYGANISTVNCSKQLLSKNSNMYCYLSKPSTLTKNDTIQMYLDNSYRTDYTFNMYVQELSIQSLILGKQITYAKFIYQDQYQCQIQYRIFKKIQIIIYDSLSLGDSPTVYTGIKDQSRLNSVFIFSDFKFMGIMNEGDIQRITFKRQDITLIIGAFLGNLNLLIGFCSIIFVSININNIKLKLTQGLYESEILSRVSISILFTLKYFIVVICQKIGITFQKYFNNQKTAHKAFTLIEYDMSVETILRQIQYLKLSKTISQSTPQQNHVEELKNTNCEKIENQQQKELPELKQNDIATNKNFSYNLVESDTTIVTQRFEVLPQAVREKKIWNLIKLFDSNPIHIEFESEKEENTSWASIFVTYLGISLLIFACIKLNLFKVESSISFTKQYMDQTTMHMNTQTNMTLYFNVYKFMLVIPFRNDSLYTVNVSLVNEAGEVIQTGFPITYGCIPNINSLPHQVYTFCFNQSVTLKNKNDEIRTDLRIIIDKHDPTSFLQYDYYFMASDLDANGKIVQKMITYEGVIYQGLQISRHFVKFLMIQSDLSSNKIYYDCEVFTQNTYVEMQRRAIVTFAAPNILKRQQVQNPTIWLLFQNIFGINLIFIVIISNYISRPFNKSLAETKLTQKYEYVQQVSPVKEAKLQNQDNKEQNKGTKQQKVIRSDTLDILQCIQWCKSKIYYSQDQKYLFFKKHID